MKTTRGGVASILTALVLGALCVGSAAAAVTGDCVNCHTMHNSQDSKSVAKDKDGVTMGTAEVNLLNSDCLGCHSNMSGNATIVSIGSGEKSRVPIVLTGTQPTDPPNPAGDSSNVLAGGNFYWVAEGDDTKGHNVYGLRDNPVDSLLTGAPGGTVCNNSECHSTLATATSGCNGCHLAAHHADDGVDSVSAQGDGWYRFLSGGMMWLSQGRDVALSKPGVIGVEDADWEQNPSLHNVYKGTTDTYIGTKSAIQYNSIGAYCSGCHSNFHHVRGDGTGMGTSGAWIRHPSDVALPTTGEYAGYTYTALAPVAYEDVAAESTAVVTCISCHRPHGSSQSDMLRWDYSGCITGTENSDCGCFACHTAKDDGSG